MKRLIIFTMFILLLSFAYAGRWDIGPKTYYNYGFNELTSPLTEFIRGNNSEADTITSKNSQGIYNYTWEFVAGSSNKVDLQDKIVDDWDEFALSIWVKPSSLNTGWIWTTRGNVGTDKSGIRTLNTGGFEYSFSTASCSEQGGGYGGYSANNWYHLLLNYNGTHISFYLNGTKLDSKVCTGKTNMEDANANAFGYRRTNNDQYYDGFIDEAVFFNESLTEDEIEMLYNSHKGLPYQEFNRELDNCSNYWNTTALNISYVRSDNKDPVQVNSTIEFTGDLYYSYSPISQSFNTICINPSNITLQETLTINYKYDGNWYYYTNDSLILSNITQNIELYVEPGETDTVILTAKDKNTGIVLNDVSVFMYRRQAGDWVVINSKLTDVTGKVQFAYEEGINYKFFFSKAGYDNYIFYLEPILFNEYDVPMSPTTTLNTTIDYEKIGLAFYPDLYYDNQQNNFTFIIQSAYNVLETYNYTLTYPGGTTTNQGTTGIGEQLTSSINIAGSELDDRVQLNYCYKIEDFTPRCFNQFFGIVIDYTGNHTISGIKGDIEDKKYGLGLFERTLIMGIFILLVMGVSALVGQLIPGLALTLLVMGYFVYIGFVPIWLVLIPIALGVLFMSLRGGGV